jgi:hypothetical protein
VPEEEDDPYDVELSLHKTEMSEDDSSKDRTTNNTPPQFRFNLISKLERRNHVERSGKKASGFLRPQKNTHRVQLF